MNGTTKLTMLIMIIIGVFMGGILGLNSISSAQVQAGSTTTTTIPANIPVKIADSFTSTKSYGGTNIVSVTSAPRFVKNSQGNWQSIEDYISMSLVSDGIKISWEDGYVTLDPMVNYKGVVYSWSQAPLAFRSFASKSFGITKNQGSYKWAMTVSNIPDLVKNDIQAIGFNVIDSTVPYTISGTTLLANNKILIDFSDIVEHNEKCTDSTVVINLTSHTVTTRTPGYSVTTEPNKIWINGVSGKNIIILDPITTINPSAANHNAYMGTVGAGPACGNTAMNYSIAEFNAGNYTNIGTSDNIYASSFYSGSCFSMLSNYSINSYSAMNWMNITLEYSSSVAGLDCDSNSSFVLWNHTGQKWEVVSSSLGVTTTDKTFTFNTTSTNFLNGTQGAHFIGRYVCDEATTQGDLKFDFAQLQYSYNNTIPVINSWTFNGVDWGTSNNIFVLLNATDADGQGDISQCWINGTSIRNTTLIDRDFCVLDVNASTAFTYYVFVNDTLNNTVTANITFQISNSALNQTASAYPRNATRQVAELNNTLNISSTMGGGNYTINYTRPHSSAVNLSAVNITGAVSATSNATIYATWSIDIVNESRNRYNVTDADIRFNRNESGYAEIRVASLSDGIALTNVTINTSALLPSSWTNAGDENFSLDINASQIAPFQNKTINRTASIIRNVSIPGSQCPSGMTVFNERCANSSTQVINGVSYDLDTVLTQFNITDNIVQGNPMVLGFDVSFYSSWSSRDLIQAMNGYINDSSTNITVSSNSTHVIINTGVIRTSGNVQGTYTVKVTYYVQQIGGSGSSGGGGSNDNSKPISQLFNPIINPILNLSQSTIQTEIATGEAFKNPVVQYELLALGGVIAFAVYANRKSRKRSRARITRI